MTTLVKKPVSFSCFIYALGILGVVLSISLLASVPPVSRDALTHHLYIPKLYIQHGGIYQIPTLKFSYYPMNLDLLYLIPLYFNNDIAPKFIHFTFALTTAFFIYRYLSRRINQTYALLGSLLFLSIPVIIRLSSTVYVDLGLICFLFGSQLYIYRWIESGFRVKYLVFSAVLCGLGLGTKYNGLIGLFLFCLFIPFIYARYHASRDFYWVRSIYYGVAFALIALLVFSPWMIRNVIWTGNPVFPLYQRVLNGSETRTVEELNETVIENRSQMSHIQLRRQIYGESWWEIALIPVRIFFEGQDDNPVHFDGKTNPFLLLLPIFVFIGIKNRSKQVKTEILLMFVFSILFFLFASAQHHIRIRYFAPIIPSLVVLAMFGLDNLKKMLQGQDWKLSKGVGMSIFIAIVSVMLGLNAQYLISRFKRDQPINYLTGKVNRDEYIQLYRPEYAAFQYANRHLSKDSKILGLYIGGRGYYSDIDISFDLKIIQQFAAKSNSSTEIVNKMQNRQFTHLLVNYDLFNYWVQRYDLHERKLLKEFFDKCVMTEFSQDGFGLLRLISPEDQS
jgi:hypothetical protein